VKLRAGNIPEGINKLKAKWQEIIPDKPFTYSFLDENVATQYESYRRWMNIMGLATFLAIMISCLGLFGLSGINAVNRTKEIGIRKVMGAETWNIFILLNKQFFWLAIASFCVAAPFSWYIMDQWLESFQYVIPMSWDIFAISLIIGLAVAISTVSYHSIRAANSNPADTLKYE
jgi:putative ABC transport system permease protein